MVIGHRARPVGGAWTPMRPEHTHVTRSGHTRRVERSAGDVHHPAPRIDGRSARVAICGGGCVVVVGVPCGPGDGEVGRLSPARVRRPSGGRGRCGHVHSLRRDGDGRFSRRYGRWSSRRASRAKRGEGRHVAQAKVAGEENPSPSLSAGGDRARWGTGEPVVGSECSGDSPRTSFDTNQPSCVTSEWQSRVHAGS